MFWLSIKKVNFWLSTLMLRPVNNLTLCVRVNCLFVFYVPVNSYGHAGRSVYLTPLFSWASLTKQLTSTSCTYFSLVTDNNIPFWISEREENGRRSYFMIKLCESMGPAGIDSRPLHLHSDTYLQSDMLLAALRGPMCEGSEGWSKPF